MSQRSKDGIDSNCTEFIHRFFMEDVIQGGFKALQASKSLENGKKEPVIQNVYYKQEELAVKYANASLFTYLTKLFIKENKEVFF